MSLPSCTLQAMRLLPCAANSYCAHDRPPDAADLVSDGHHTSKVKRNLASTAQDGDRRRYDGVKPSRQGDHPSGRLSGRFRLQSGVVSMQTVLQAFTSRFTTTHEVQYDQILAHRTGLSHRGQPCPASRRVRANVQG